MSYAQEGEDMLLRLLLDGQAEGFYVDIGAHHPRRFSNTCYFYAQGWRGLNVDADPDAIAAFERERPDDVNVLVGVGAEAGEFEFTQYFESALNTFDAEQVAYLAREAPHYEVSQVTHARVERLDTILDAHLEPRQQIDFMSVDVEGRDLEVLQSNDWRRFRPRYVLAEIPVPPALIERHRTYAFMVAQGYECVAKTPRTGAFKEVGSPAAACR
jgi:FkbM family methyltransferase